MRDLNRKLEKFLKEKAEVQKKPKITSTPSKSTVASPCKPVTATITKKVNCRNFSMTLSFYNNPKFNEQGPRQNYAILHESQKLKSLDTAPLTERARSPRRNPIIQDGDEPVQEIRSTLKISPLSGKTTMFTEEPAYSRKMRGEFNGIQSARSLSPRPQGIRTNIAPVRLQNPEDQPRQLKTVVVPHMNNVYNPIVEGDPKSVKLIRERNHAQPSEEYLKMNDKKSILGADRGTSPKGRVFWDTKIPLGSNLSETYTPDQKFSSPRKTQPSDGLKDLIEYTYSPTFRDQGVSAKCNSVPISAVLRTSAN